MTTKTKIVLRIAWAVGLGLGVAALLLGIRNMVSSSREQSNTDRIPELADATDANAENVAFSFVPSEKQTSDQPIVRKFVQRYRDLPPLLAAAATAYPTSVLEPCGLEEMDAAVLNGMLYTDENGGEIQQKLWDSLDTLLESEETIIELGYASGSARETQARIAYQTPEGFDILELFWTDVDLQDELCLAISVPDLEEIGYFRLSSGFGRLVPAET